MDQKIKQQALADALHQLEKIGESLQHFARSMHCALVDEDLGDRLAPVDKQPAKPTKAKAAPATADSVTTPRDAVATPVTLEQIKSAMLRLQARDALSFVTATLEATGHSRITTMSDEQRASVHAALVAEADRLEAA